MAINYCITLPLLYNNHKIKAQNNSIYFTEEPVSPLRQLCSACLISSWDQLEWVLLGARQSTREQTLSRRSIQASACGESVGNPCPK